MLGRTDSRPRTLLLLAILLVFGAACVARLGYWQLGRHDWLVAPAAGMLAADAIFPARFYARDRDRNFPERSGAADPSPPPPDTADRWSPDRPPHRTPGSKR